MTWRAFEELDTAVDATKLLLLPFALRRWLVLAIVVVFVGVSPGGLPSIQIDVGPSELDWGAPPWDDPTVAPWQVGEAIGIGDPGIGDMAVSAPSGIVIAVVLLGLAVALAVGIAFVGATMEFVFVEIARSRTVQIRGFFGQHLRAGATLFGLRLGVGLVVLAGGLALVLGALLVGGLVPLLVVLFLPAVFLVGVGIWVFLRFTADFVVPITVGADTGVIDAWRQFWPALRADWREYGVYAAVRVVLRLVSGVVVGIGYATVGLVLAVPFFIVGLLGLLLFGVAGVEILGIVWGVLVVMLFGLSVLVVGTIVVTVPVQTYLRYYGLLVLGAVSPEFEVLEDVRGAIADA